MDIMTFPQTTAWLAVFLGFLVLVLTARVSIARQNSGTPFGDGSIGQTVRAQANLTETAALVLILLGLAEMGGARGLFVTVIAVFYAVVRVVHAIGVTSGDGNGPLRIVGGGGTLLTLLASSGLLVLTLL
ncbi:MAPEG family protein [uncultured Tateyamaria sp.]|uniref:MAPEG family protein n=1 Tax=uncultured Tateyamaria sp. TaxID=455651 RepID=UPI00260F67F3|nr:MAPEG family protein [uncultured Tateyamaria sp.]